MKASAGAVEHLRLAPVDDLAGALADLHARGLRIVGADGDASLTAREADLRGQIAIVVGSEGRGLGAAVRRRCDLLVRIPMHGRIESLNAAVAGSILLYEAAAQRRLPESELRPPASDEGSDEGSGGVPETLDRDDGPGAAPADPVAPGEPVAAEVAEPASGRNRGVVPPTPALEPVQGGESSAVDGDELLPGEPAVEVPDPAASLDSGPAGDTPQV